MKKMKDDPDLMEEYDFGGGVRGKYAQRFQEGSNVVVIEPDVAEFFPDHDSVNEALRNLVAVSRRQVKAEQGHGGRRSQTRDPRTRPLNCDLIRMNEVASS